MKDILLKAWKLKPAQRKAVLEYIDWQEFKTERGK